MTIQGRALIGLAVALMMFGAVAPALAASPTYPATAMAPSGVAWVQLGGYPGVSVNYTNNLGSNFQGIVFVDVYNAAGQSVLVSNGAANIAAGQKVDCYVPVIGLAPGSYTAQLFVVTTTNVPVSVTSTLEFSA